MSQISRALSICPLLPGISARPRARPLAHRDVGTTATASSIAAKCEFADPGGGRVDLDCFTTWHIVMSNPLRASERELSPIGGNRLRDAALRGECVTGPS
jgi:hypothetical protein